MSGPWARRYALFCAIFLTLQGTSTLLFRLVPALDRAFPLLLEATRMVPVHSLLHIATALLAIGVLWHGGAAPTWFAASFGAFYAGLAAVGQVSGSQLCLGLQPFDHPFHLLLGGLGLVACGLDLAAQRRSRSP